MNIKRIIREEMDGLDWIKDEELPILPYIGKRFKLITDDGQDSGRRYQILEYYFEDKYNKDFYIKSILLNSTTLKPETKKFGLAQGQIFHTPIRRAMELINNGNWVFLDTINEPEKILESLFNKLSILTEDGKTEPDMEWDFTKGELDKSKKWVKTKEDVKKYLTLLFDKMKRIPKKVKINILKYVLASFVGILTVSELTKVVDEVSDGKIILNKPTEKIIEPEVVKVERIRKPSDSLIDFLKDEEGYSDEGYNIGDGKITIGWGHAEDVGDSQYKVGQKISKQEAEKLLRQDVKVASDALNRILDKWESDGIKVDINQDMYDAMTSMSYNMGIGNFRNSDFIQMVKRGEMEKAKEEIKSVSSQMFNKYPGLKKRRKKESEMFNLV